ncbi:MAG: respiratory nitrate reductase subunit gamma [Desulfobacteraceae bacterium]|nr:respiratory nitrate reductase subunit gamma [Desulfobacteraceae bacterium]
MNGFLHTLGFVVFPYIALTVFVFGHAWRYVTDWKRWNAASSQFLHKDSIKGGITIFHWGALLTLLGHAGGMLIPQRIYDVFGVNAAAHNFMAHWAGLVAGMLMVPGVIWLLVRRIRQDRIAANTPVHDYILLGMLLVVSGLGLYNVVFTHYDVLYSVAPWIRSIVILAPQPDLMAPVPVSYKLHIITALVLLGYSPFTRLVHIWSAPVTYLYRSYVIFRKSPGTKGA